MRRKLFTPLLSPSHPFFLCIVNYFIHKIWRSPVNFFSCFLILSKTHNRMEIIFFSYRNYCSVMSVTLSSLPGKSKCSLFSVFFGPDGITLNSGLTGPNNTCIYIYILSSIDTVWLYHKYSEWLDTQNASMLESKPSWLYVNR